MRCGVKNTGKLAGGMRCVREVSSFVVYWQTATDTASVNQVNGTISPVRGPALSR
jgi:hypothetical protein